MTYIVGHDCAACPAHAKNLQEPDVTGPATPALPP